MPQFIYKAKKSPEETIEDIILADNRTAAIHRVAQLGYHLLSLEEFIQAEKGKQFSFTFLRKKISLKDLSNFTRQLSDLLEGGLTIVRALDLLRKQTVNPALAEVINDIREYCIDGNSLSSALARHPKVFSNLYVSMIASGEKGGALEVILRRLADFNDKQLDIQVKVRSALAYPIFMAMVGVLTITVLLTFVIPRMMTMFSDLGQSLPLPTRILLAVSNTVQHYWWFILIVVATAGFLISQLYQTKDGKGKIDALLLKSPILGEVIMKVEISRFLRTLATLLNNGVGVLESFKVVNQITHNAVIKNEVSKAAEKVKAGSDLASAFAASPIIPPLVTNMIAVGEESGQIGKALNNVAGSYEREVDNAIKIMMTLIEPLLILVLGVIVGFIVISMLLPIFELNLLVQ